MPTRRLQVRTWPRRPPVLSRVALAMVLTLGTACTGHARTANATLSRESAPTATPSTGKKTGSAPVSRVQIAKAQAKATYLSMWHDFVVAGRTSNWESPMLSAHATGDALLQMSRGLYADHLNGLVTRGQPIDAPTVKSIDPATSPTTVLVADCGDSTHWVKYVAKTGQLATRVPGGRQAITAEVKRQRDGKWKVDQFAVEAVGTC
jgi:hypothetical protein